MGVDDCFPHKFATGKEIIANEPSSLAARVVKGLSERDDILCWRLFSV